MMNLIIENWVLIVVGIVALIIAGISVYNFITLPRTEKFKKIKAMLLYWVTLAESELGNGTGALKLRYVYDLFTDKYKFIAHFISFEKFSNWVDDALVEMREMLDTNKFVFEMIKGEIFDSESEL